MYRHLLVPIDGSDLAVELVGNAVALARSLNARITFFHAIPDHAGTWRGDAEVVRLTSSEDYAYMFTGKARELLAKSEAAARALAVPCDSLHVVNDKPAQAIVAAAREKGCDLIFMASHGGRNKLAMTLGSQTIAVLMNAGMPVLVSSLGELPPPSRAIGIIRDEHRSLAAVLHAWMHALAEASAQEAGADPVLMRAIISYIQRFPVALHHPKEEDYLFKRLRQRTHSVDMELEELERQHERDRELLADLAQQVQALEQADTAAAAATITRALDLSVRAYAATLWEHMGREEGVILPAAQRHLNTDDWLEIDAAFAANSDPRFAGESEREFRHLFSRIVNAARDWPSGP